MSYKVYCVLGGGGSFGIHAAHYLLDNADPHKVVGVGRGPLRPEPWSLGIAGREDYEYRALHVGHEFDLLCEYLDYVRPQVVVNFAAQGEGAHSWRHSWRFFDTNATALVRLHEWLSERNWFNPSGLFVQIGTSELYGSTLEAAREDAPIRPSSPYAASKAAFDMHLQAVHAAGRSCRTIILRPSNCYCSGQLLHRLIPRAIVSGLLGRRVPLHGGGAAQKSYLHARDLARAIHLACEVGVPGQIYNVGPLEPIAIRDVAEMCAAEVGKETDELFDVAPERVGQDARYWLDSSAIRALGWAQEVDWPEGLGEVHDWAARNIEALSRATTDYQLRA